MIEDRYTAVKEMLFSRKDILKSTQEDEKLVYYTLSVIKYLCV